jgi:excisionase family DNA binding protein
LRELVKWGAEIRLFRILRLARNVLVYKTEKGSLAMQSLKSLKHGSKPTPTELLAQKAQLALSSVPDGPIRLGFGETEFLDLPRSITPLLIEILGEMAQGNDVKIHSTSTEVTTQQAADILNVSRPYLVGLLDAHRIPSRKVGTHRRVKVSDVMLYKSKTGAAKNEALNELAVQAQDSSMGY